MSLESMRGEPKIKYVRRWQYVYDLLWEHRVGVRSFAVRMGFDILGTLPEWYINLIYITVCAGLGLKGVGGISKFMKGKK